MKKLSFLLCLMISSLALFSQAPNWNIDENFTYTKFFDDFNNPQLSKWRPNFIYRGLGQMIDSSLTHRVQNGKLELTMARVQNYNDSANYVGQEFWTNEDFSFGIFECKATFAKGLGSWPAFWAFRNGSCINNEGPEIDFAEYSCKFLTPPPNKMVHCFHHWICGGGGELPTDYKVDYQFDATTNVYKCIWTPDKAEFYVDGIKKATFVNDGQNWFPLQNMYVIVSQQICPPNGGYSPLVPQTSYFEWVKVQQYFKPPVVTLSSNTICSSGSATLDVDSKATNISWVLSPSNLFSGSTSGTGKTATINAATGASGLGKITYSFDMPSDLPNNENFTVEKEFYVGAPDPDDITIVDLGPNYPSSMVLCDDMPNDGKLKWDHPGSILEYEWSVYDDGGNTWQVNQHPMDPFPLVDMQDVQFSKPYGSVNGNVNVIFKARNVCDWGNSLSPAMQFTTSSCGGMMLLMNPNPGSGITTLSIEPDTENESSLKSATSQSTFDEKEEWEYEVYSSMQSLKAKKTKIKGKSTQLNTQGWKEGVYTVRAKYKNKVLTGKLVVKR